MPAREADWVQAPPGPLPLTVIPTHNETLDSYLRRLAATNRLDPDALRAHIVRDGRQSAPITADQVALVSGQPAAVLTRALPQLTRPGDPTGNPMVLTSTSWHHNGCRHCQFARGHRRPARCWAHPHHAVCLRHQRWLGDGYHEADHSQPDLRRQPDIITANRRHRRLVRRYGLRQATIAYREAAWICRRWHDARTHDQDFYRLMEVFHGTSWNLARTDPTLQAARYPQIVALTRLLASPYWRAKADKPKPIEFVAEIQRTVAPHYIWTLANPYRRYDPLVQTLGHHLSPVEN